MDLFILCELKFLPMHTSFCLRLVLGFGDEAFSMTDVALGLEDMLTLDERMIKNLVFDGESPHEQIV